MRGMSSQAITQWGGHIRPQPTHTAVLSAAKYSGVLLIWERDAPLLRIEDYLLFPLSLLYVRRLIVVLAPDNVFEMSHRLGHGDRLEPDDGRAGGFLVPGTYTLVPGTVSLEQRDAGCGVDNFPF